MTVSKSVLSDYRDERGSLVTFGGNGKGQTRGYGTLTNGLTMDSEFTEFQTAAVDAYVNDLLNPDFYETIYQRVTRKENECLQKKVLELDEDKKVFENNLISSQSRVMELSKQVTDFEQIVIIERSNFEKERKVFEEERNVFVNERKSFELKSEKLLQKISDLERKFVIDRKEFERQMKNSLKKPSLRAGKYQNMVHEFEEEIQVVHS
ncbi:hypothetical protein OSB04_002330 [Centaurea solstitialis]|uniref:Uncharacterized protein n=1 Tax=Centaurea solstitialis TaxID=347529 RepID=A0AA38TUI7_9ASTR|nr:hypothetical protein OSB04_002330 [Centaurea solstitialis]